MPITRLVRRLALLLLAGFGLAASPALAAAQETPLPWWNDRVFYEIFVRSFYDSNGDGIGDLRGVIEKLDYLNDGNPDTTDDLGVTGIWLMPIMPSPSYHGYNVTDYFGINPQYGTFDDLRELIDAAHQRGIAVIVDMVPNHTSRSHPWFIASAQGDPTYEDYYVWSDTDPGYRGPEGQQVWHSLGNRYYYGLFDAGMPDLNYRNPAVTAEMYEVARFWLEDVGVDGFRLDAIRHLIEEGDNQENTASTHAWLADFEAYIQQIAPDSMTVGEAWTSTFQARNYVRDGEMDLTFDFDLALSMLESAFRGTNTAVAATQTRDFALYPPNQYGAFLTNHDIDRVMSQLRGSVDKAKIAASMLMTGPGVPFIYYGEEIGMTGIKPDQNIRTPMQWDATPGTAGFTSASHPWQRLGAGNTAGVNVADQQADDESLWRHYQRLIALRNQTPALRHGNFTALDCDTRQVYAFLRDSDEQNVLVLINLSADSVSDWTCDMDATSLRGAQTPVVLYSDSDVPTPAAFTVGEDGSLSGYAPGVTLPPYSLTVVELTAE